MAFIVKADLATKILIDELNEITRGDDTLVTQACIAAEAEARGYIYDTFDVDVIFATTGTNRNALLLDMLADMAIYLLVARCQAGQYLEDRQSRYDRAVKWFKAAAKTESYNDLPRREATKQNHISYGSNPKRTNYF